MSQESAGYHRPASSGSALGIFGFRSINEQTFRRIILAVLLVSGALLFV